MKLEKESSKTDGVIGGKRGAHEIITGHKPLKERHD